MSTEANYSQGQMVGCNCGDYGLPKSGPYHSWHCRLVQNSLEVLGPDDDKFYVEIPQHMNARDGEMIDKRSPWPDRLQAEGAMHRLLRAYPEKLVVLFRDDTIIAAGSLEDETQHYYFCKNDSLYDWQSGKKAYFK
jgi:hypothetical protein